MLRRISSGPPREGNSKTRSRIIYKKLSNLKGNSSDIISVSSILNGSGVKPIKMSQGMQPIRYSGSNNSSAQYCFRGEEKAQINDSLASYWSYPDPEEDSFIVPRNSFLCISQNSFSVYLINLYSHV